MDHYRYFIILIALIYCISLIICCSSCQTGREALLASENQRSPRFVLAIRQLHFSNGAFTHRQPQTNQVLCNYHLSWVVAERAFCKMKGTRKAFVVKLEISLWFLDKNLLPCYVLQTPTAREVYGCKQ